MPQTKMYPHFRMADWREGSQLGHPLEPWGKLSQPEKMEHNSDSLEQQLPRLSLTALVALALVAQQDSTNIAWASCKGCILCWRDVSRALHHDHVSQWMNWDGNNLIKCEKKTSDLWLHYWGGHRSWIWSCKLRENRFDDVRSWKVSAVDSECSSCCIYIRKLYKRLWMKFQRKKTQLGV